jgi:hypothetical protein
MNKRWPCGRRPSATPTASHAKEVPSATAPRVTISGKLSQVVRSLASNCVIRTSHCCADVLAPRRIARKIKSSSPCWAPSQSPNGDYFTFTGDLTTLGTSVPSDEYRQPARRHRSDRASHSHAQFAGVDSCTRGCPEEVNLRFECHHWILPPSNREMLESRSLDADCASRQVRDSQQDTRKKLSL